MSANAQEVVSGLFAKADIQMNGSRPWDLCVHDDRFYRRVLARGTLGFGEAYMDGWWDCAALDEMCCRAARSRLDEQVPMNVSALLATTGAVIWNLQSERRAR